MNWYISERIYIYKDGTNNRGDALAEEDWLI